MNVKVCQSWGSEDDKRRNICGEPVKTKDSHEDKEAEEHKSDDTDRQQMNEKDEQGCGPCGGDQQQSQGLEDGRDQGRDEGQGNLRDQAHEEDQDNDEEEDHGGEDDHGGDEDQGDDEDHVGEEDPRRARLSGLSLTLGRGALPRALRFLFSTISIIQLITSTLRF